MNTDIAYLHSVLLPYCYRIITPWQGAYDLYQEKVQSVQEINDIAYYTGIAVSFSICETVLVNFIKNHASELHISEILQWAQERDTDNKHRNEKVELYFLSHFLDVDFVKKQMHEDYMSYKNIALQWKSNFIKTEKNKKQRDVLKRITSSANKILSSHSKKSSKDLFEEFFG